MKRRKGETVIVRRGSHFLWECCTAFGGVVLRHCTNTHEDLAQSGRIFFLCLLLWVRLHRTCRHDGRSVWPSLRFLGKYVATLSLECCFGGNVLAAVRFPDGGNCVSAAVRNRAGRLAAEGIAHPSQRRTVGHPLSVCLQHRNRRHQHAARQRKPPLTRVRPEGDTSAVALRGGTACGTVACPKPPRGACTRHRALDVGCLRHEGHCGGVPPPCRWTDA
ncbi:hypothetical protein BCY84_05479 [Trypanosoma cruzi cruzi]|nr:hypothetical protein BCY84_05479 [Trypanosoma cruzi cruzi]